MLQMTRATNLTMNFQHNNQIKKMQCVSSWSGQDQTQSLAHKTWSLMRKLLVVLLTVMVLIGLQEVYQTFCQWHETSTKTNLRKTVLRLLRAVKVTLQETLLNILALIQKIGTQQMLMQKQQQRFSMLLLIRELNLMLVKIYLMLMLETMSMWQKWMDITQPSMLMKDNLLNTPPLRQCEMVSMASLQMPMVL